MTYVEYCRMKCFSKEQQTKSPEELASDVSDKVHKKLMAGCKNLPEDKKNDCQAEALIQTKEAYYQELKNIGNKAKKGQSKK